MKTAEALLALKTRVLYVVTYPFGLISFTFKQCKRISVILEDAILPTLNINRKMKKAAVYALLELGSIGLPNIGLILDQKIYSIW